MLSGVTCSDGTIPAFEFNWKLENNNPGGAVPYWSVGNKKDFTVDQTFLKTIYQGQVYIVTLVISACGGEEVNERSKMIEINVLPRGGTCNVAPSYGFYLDTTFLIE